jgi:predicted amidohydrolase
VRLDKSLLKTTLFILGACCSVHQAWAVAAEEVPNSLNARLAEIEKLGENPVIVAAVEARNSRGMSMDDIKKRDAEWMANKEGIDEGMREIMENDAAKALRTIEKSEPYYVEMFVVDNQGANVAMTNKTSDFWQGDEEKFTETFKGGQGEVFIAAPEFDDSANAYLIQVSVPVKSSGRTIGALTIGVNLDILADAAER